MTCVVYKRQHRKLDRYFNSISTLPPYYNGVVPTIKLLDFSEENLARLTIVSYYVRGFERRHWTKLCKEMERNRFDKNFVENVKLSFLKFKWLSALRPQMRVHLLWIFKNLLNVDGQKFYKTVKDYYFDQHPGYGMEQAMEYVYKSRGEWGKYSRTMQYLEKEGTRWFVPTSFFPLIDPGKSLKMPLAFLPYSVDFEKKQLFRNMFSTYIAKLEVKSLFVPPVDILDKIGNNKYNDGGFVRSDFMAPERSFDSSFLYQKFITQPLSMREVWLPGKGIKINNTFWMVVCSQLLHADMRYPCTDKEELWRRIGPKITGPMSRFDISGFGFQFLREWLEIGAACICELYPNSILDDLYGGLVHILNNVEVEMEDGKKVKPPRGIGLGYYEDLKTLCVLALLDEFDPLSLYGDQGLLSLETSFDAVQRLIDFQFVVDFEKVEWVGSTERPTIKWAGASFNEVEVIGIDKFSDDLAGAFFQEFHWERKFSLRSVMESNPSVYNQVQRRLQFLYQRFFGWEFFREESRCHFDNMGISMFGYQSGWDRTYKVAERKTPFEATLFSTHFVTPFKAISKKAYPRRMSKDFSVSRKKIFRNTDLNYRFMYDYLSPRYLYKKDKPSIGERVLPQWADLLYFVNHGKISGSLTWGLSPPAIESAYKQYPNSSNPCHVKASGGRRPLTNWRAPEVLDLSSFEEMEVLRDVSRRDLPRVNRADTQQDPAWSEDPLYRDTDLNRYHSDLGGKRPPSVTLSDLVDEADVRAHFTKAMRVDMTHGTITRVADVLALVPGLLERDSPQQDDPMSSAFNDQEDESIGGEDIDLILEDYI
jgi:hypothetical protein